MNLAAGFVHRDYEVSATVSAAGLREENHTSRPTLDILSVAMRAFDHMLNRAQPDNVCTIRDVMLSRIE